jgi:hypothetical protein
MGMTGQSTVALAIRLLDYPAVVIAPDIEARTAAQSILRGFPQVEAARDSARYTLARDERGGWYVEARGARTCQGVALTDALVALEWQLVTDVLAFRHDRFHLHGAALCEPSGSTSVLILGAPGAGKTTLALALMARGFLPFSDDVTLIEPETLTPRTFPRAFHVDASTRMLVEAMPHPPPGQFAEIAPGYFLPSRWADSHAPARVVFLPAVRRGEAPTVTPLSVADATAQLLPFSLTLEAAPRLALSVAARLTAQARCYVLGSGDLAATADLVAAVTAQMRPIPRGGAARPPNPTAAQ